MRPSRFETPVSDSPRTADPRLAALRLWLSLGTLVWLLLPSAAWYQPAIGWLPYWLVAAPAIGLALLRRTRLQHGSPLRGVASRSRLGTRLRR